MLNLSKLLGKKENISNNMHLRDPNSYNLKVYVNKVIGDNIKLIANAEHLSIKAATEALLTKGISVYLGNAIAENTLLQQSGKKYAYSSNTIRKVKDKLKESDTSDYIIKKNGL